MSAAAPGRAPRVVHLTSVHDAFDIRIFRKECRSLAAAGYDVVLVAPHDRDEVVDGVRIKAVARPGSRLERMLRTSWAVFRAGVRERGALYHLHDPELLLFGVWLQLTGHAVVYDAHEDAPRDILSKHYLPRPVRAVLAVLVDALERAVCSAFAGVVTVTAPIAARFDPRRTVVAHNYPLLAEFPAPGTQPFAERARAAVYVGGLSRIRGVREMVAAIGRAAEHGAAELWLAGRLDPPALEAELAREPGWAHTARLGWCDRERIVSLLGSARVGLLVLHPVPNHLGSLPIKLFEYMGAGLPVVASDFPMWRSVLGDAAKWVDPLDPQAIAAATTWLFDHPEEAQRMGRLGREAVESRFHWEREAQVLLALYARIVGAPREVAA